jgi:hypothetical protein
VTYVDVDAEDLCLDTVDQLLLQPGSADEARAVAAIMRSPKGIFKRYLRAKARRESGAVSERAVTAGGGVLFWAGGRGRGRG